MLRPKEVPLQEHTSRGSLACTYANTATQARGHKQARIRLRTREGGQFHGCGGAFMKARLQHGCDSLLIQQGVHSKIRNAAAILKSLKKSQQRIRSKIKKTGATSRQQIRNRGFTATSISR